MKQELALAAQKINQEFALKRESVDSVIAWQRFCDHARKDHHIQNAK